MARRKKNRGSGEQSSAPASAVTEDPNAAPEGADSDSEEDEGEEDGEAAPAPERRRQALCIESCTVCFANGTSHMMGGEWVTEEFYVRVIDRDSHFKVFEGTIPELKQMRDDLEAHVKEARAMLEPYGFVVSRHGELVVPKRR